MAGYIKHKGGDTWELQVNLGTDFSGKRKRATKTIHCKSKREAEKQLSRFVIECEDGTVNSSKPVTVQALCDLYLKESAERYQKRNTVISNISRIDNWILPFLGKRKISTLKKLDVQQWINMISDQGKSPKTVRNIYSVFRTIMDYAVFLELVHKNPCDNIQLPSIKKKEAQSYSLDDVQRIIAAFSNITAEEQSLKCFILLSLFGGFRKGEILGFNWEDVDYDHDTISVVRTRYRDQKAENIFIDTPKSDKSVRTVSLPAFMFDELRKLSTQQKIEKLLFGPAYQDSEAMIRKADGSVMNPDKPYKWFKNICDANGIPFYGLHALRHTHASLMASMGTDYVHLSKRLGHAQISTTLNIYTHLFEDKENELANKLDDFANKLAK